MGVYPKLFNKESFVKYLRKIKINEEIIERLSNLPDEVLYDNVWYKLYIATRWYSGGKTHYEFELNYYSEEMVKFLLNIEPYSDIEISLNHIECELRNLKLFDDDQSCPDKID